MMDKMTDLFERQLERDNRAAAVDLGITEALKSIAAALSTGNSGRQL